MRVERQKDLSSFAGRSPAQTHDAHAAAHRGRRPGVSSAPAHRLGCSHLPDGAPSLLRPADAAFKPALPSSRHPLLLHLQRWMSSAAGLSDQLKDLPPYASNVGWVATLPWLVGLLLCCFLSSHPGSLTAPAEILGRPLSLVQPKWERVQAAKEQALLGGGEQRIAKQHEKVGRGGEGGGGGCCD